MAQLVKLFGDERELLTHLQADALILIRDCKSIEPIKLFVEAHDILRLTWDIQIHFPREWPEPPECDEMALLQLKTITQSLFVGHGQELPRPGFDLFSTKVRKLLRLFRVPKGEYLNVRPEVGDWPEAFDEKRMPYLYGLDALPPDDGDEK